MNIRLPAILMWTTGVQGFDPSPYDDIWLWDKTLATAGYDWWLVVAMHSSSVKNDPENGGLLRHRATPSHPAIWARDFAMEMFAIQRAWGTPMTYWLVVYLPLWKILETVGMIFHSQVFLESHSPFHGSSHHQPDKEKNRLMDPPRNLIGLFQNISNHQPA